MCSLTDMISTAYYIICSSSSSKFDEFHCFHQLHLQEGGLHADINGDGVLDHVQVCNCFFHLRQSKLYECIFYCLLVMMYAPNMLSLKYILYDMP